MNNSNSESEDATSPAKKILIPQAAKPFSRRSFLQSVSIAAAAMGLPQARAQTKVIQGFEKAPDDPNISVGWKPISDRKIRVGIAGYGLCQFGAAFEFQNHPNVEIVAVTDLIPERCEGLAKACRCSKTYPSLEEMVKNDSIEAVFLATDPPHHAQHAILALNHGKHVATAVPAVWARWRMRTSFLKR